MKQQAIDQLHQLSSLKPIVAFAENQLHALELWTTHHAEDSPMAKMSIKGYSTNIQKFHILCLERADLVDQIGREIEVLERPEYAQLVNAERLRETQQKISELFVVCLIKCCIKYINLSIIFPNNKCALLLHHNNALN